MCRMDPACCADPGAGQGDREGCQRLAQCSLAYCPDIVKMIITEFGEIWGQKYCKFNQPFS